MRWALPYPPRTEGRSPRVSGLPAPLSSLSCRLGAVHPWDPHCLPSSIARQQPCTSTCPPRSVVVAVDLALSVISRGILTLAELGPVERMAWAGDVLVVLDGLGRHSFLDCLPNEGNQAVETVLRQTDSGEHEAEFRGTVLPVKAKKVEGWLAPVLGERRLRKASG